MCMVLKLNILVINQKIMITQFCSFPQFCRASVVSLYLLPMRAFGHILFLSGRKALLCTHLREKMLHLGFD